MRRHIPRLRHRSVRRARVGGQPLHDSHSPRVFTTRKFDVHHQDRTPVYPADTNARPKPQPQPTGPDGIQPVPPRSKERERARKDPEPIQRHGDYRSRHTLLRADQLAELEVQVVRVESLPGLRPTGVRSTPLRRCPNTAGPQPRRPEKGDASAPDHLQSPFMRNHVVDHLLSMVQPVSHNLAATSPDKAFSRTGAADRQPEHLATSESTRGNQNEHASRVEGPAIVGAQPK